MIYSGTEEIDAVNDYDQFMKSSSYYYVPLGIADQPSKEQ